MRSVWLRAGSSHRERVGCVKVTPPLCRARGALACKPDRQPERGRALQGRVVDLEKVGDLDNPTLGDECHMCGVLVVGGVRGLVGEFHRKAKVEIVLGAGLPKALEGGDPRDVGEHEGCLEEGCLLLRSRGVGKRESYGVSNHGVSFHGDVPWEDSFRALRHIGYTGPISVEWEDAGMDRLHGAKEAVGFIRSLLWKLPEHSFDAAFSNQS